MSQRRAATTAGRTEGDGPVQVACEVLACRRNGPYWTLSFASREIAERARPGQFVQIGVRGQSTLLRRPFSIANVSRQGPVVGTVDVVFDAHGPGTEWLATVGTHDVIDVVGPLGTSFPLPQRKVNTLLVGGGYGTAPLFYLAEQLGRKGLRVDMIVGAATGDRILGVIEAKRLSASVTFTTDDGSYGTRGRVTDVLDEVMRTTKTGVVYACGPNPMLSALSARCVELGLPIQVAVEERMACGIGVCFTCVMPMRGRDGLVRMKRTCIEGPVLNGAKVAWDVSRYDLGASPPDDQVTGEPPATSTDADVWGTP